MKGRMVRCWHPDSPGSKVVVWRPWWRRKARLFATDVEMADWYRRRMRPTFDAIAYHEMKGT